jgi:hypothetical protein
MTSEQLIYIQNRTERITDFRLYFFVFWGNTHAYGAKENNGAIVVNMSLQ